MNKYFEIILKTTNPFQCAPNLFSSTSAPPKKPLKRKILERNRLPDFPGLRSIRFQKKVRAFRVQGSQGTPKWAKWRMIAQCRLYWDPYCNGLWETQCIILQILMVFRVCRIPETFLRTLRAHQHQNIHLQHKIKFYNIFDIYFLWFWDGFSSKNRCFL